MTAAAAEEMMDANTYKLTILAGSRVKEDAAVERDIWRMIRFTRSFLSAQARTARAEASEMLWFLDPPLRAPRSLRPQGLYPTPPQRRRMVPCISALRPPANSTDAVYDTVGMKGIHPSAMGPLEIARVMMRWR